MKLRMADEVDLPFRIIIRQNDRIVKRCETWTLQARRSRTNSRRSSSQSNINVQCEAWDEMNFSAIHTESQHEEGAMSLSIAVPFQVLLYRHRNATRLARGFWHTEILDGRQRMGNEMDRSPKTARESLSADFPFDCAASDKHFMTDSSRLRGSASSDWILCGHLTQKANLSTGSYVLRISLSIKDTPDDYIFRLKYKAVDIGTIDSVTGQVAITRSPFQKSSRDYRIETPVVARHKRHYSDLSQELGHTEMTGLTPFTHRLTLVTLASSDDHLSKRHTMRSRSQPPDDTPRVAISRKRKYHGIQSGRDSPDIPRSHAGISPTTSMPFLARSAASLSINNMQENNLGHVLRCTPGVTQAPRYEIEVKRNLYDGIKPLYQQLPKLGPIDSTKDTYTTVLNARMMDFKVYDQ